jgi:hypothetical protein
MEDVREWQRLAGRVDSLPACFRSAGWKPALPGMGSAAMKPPE